MLTILVKLSLSIYYYYHYYYYYNYNLFLSHLWNLLKQISCNKLTVITLRTRLSRFKFSRWSGRRRNWKHCGRNSLPWIFWRAGFGRPPCRGRRQEVAPQVSQTSEVLIFLRQTLISCSVLVSSPNYCSQSLCLVQHINLKWEKSQTVDQQMVESSQVLVQGGDECSQRHGQHFRGHLSKQQTLPQRECLPAHVHQLCSVRRCQFLCQQVNAIHCLISVELF